MIRKGYVVILGISELEQIKSESGTLPEKYDLIAGIEYMTDVQGVHYTYDVNTNTNYNSVAEKNVGMFGMKQIAIFLKEELNKII